MKIEESKNRKIEKTQKICMVPKTVINKTYIKGPTILCIWSKNKNKNCKATIALATYNSEVYIDLSVQQSANVKIKAKVYSAGSNLQLWIVIQKM